MKNFKLYLAAAGLMLITAAVFAKSENFITNPIYASTSDVSPTLGNSTQLTSSANLVGFTDTPTGAGEQTTITNQNSDVLYVYSYDGSSFTKLYSVGW